MDDPFILFGAGRILHLIESGKLSGIGDRVEYIIDNSAEGSVQAFGRSIPVFKPDKLMEEAECTVLITSYVHLADMFDQLQRMNLPDTITCCAYPFMQLREKHYTRGIFEDLKFGESEDEGGDVRKNCDVIPKAIHSFWFGNDDKPDEYKRCEDSWYRFCPDYEIREWNRDSYDCEKHPFLCKAIECEAWAYATDYARLDVIGKYGGIYLDTDIEILHVPGRLLNASGFFGFFDQGVIDLAAFGAVPGNTLIQNLLHLYDGADIPETKEEFSLFFQPFYLMDEFRRHGVLLDGEYQMIDGNVFLPREIMFPMDTIMYDVDALCDETIMIHHNNAGWKKSGYRENKARRSRQIYELFIEAGSADVQENRQDASAEA